VEEVLTAKGKPVTIPAATRLTIREYKRLTETAHQRRTSLSDVMREAVRGWLAMQNHAMEEAACTRPRT